MTRIKISTLIGAFILIVFGEFSDLYSQCHLVYDYNGDAVESPYWYECSGSNFALNVQSPDTWDDYTIDWGDGSAITSGVAWSPPTAVTHVYTATVDTFEVTLTDVSTGCVLTGVVVMEEATSSSIQIPIGGITQACAPQEMEFINSSTNVSETTTFIWDFGDGSSPITYDYTNWNQTVTHTYEQGTVDCETEVSLTASNYCNTIQGGSSIATFNPIRIWDLDEAAIGASATVLCYPDTTVSLENISERNCLTQGNITQRYEYWNFGDYWGLGYDSIVDWTPWPPTFPYVLHYPGLGTYQAMLLDSNYCGVDTAYITIQIVEPPVANIGISNDTVCVGELVTFYQYATGTIDSYSWNFGDGNQWLPTGSGDISYLFNNPGTYYVCNAIGVESSSSCSDTSCVTLTVLPGPDAIINADNLSSCDSLDVNFSSGSVGATSWEWNFEVAPFSFTGENPPPISFNQAGNYWVTLTVENAFGCSSSTSDTVRIFPPPTPLFSASNACVNSVSEFVDQSTFDINDPILSWNWDFGDGNTSNFQHPINEYNSTGNFDVTLTVSTANCSESATTQITIDPSPTITGFADTYSGCSSLDVQFTSVSTDATQFSWDFGDGNVSGLENPAHTFHNTGANDTTFTVAVTASSLIGCSQSDSLYIIVNPGALASFIDNSVPPGCSPFEATFENTSIGATSYLWDFGDGTTSTLENPIHNYTNNTGFLETYTVSLVAYSSNGCNDSITSSVTVYPAANFDFTIWPDSGCAPLAITMPFVQGVTDFNWDFGDGTTSTLATPTHLFENPTNDPIIYDVSLVGISAFGCVDSSSSSVIVNPQPTAQFTLDVAAGCSPLEVNFNNISTQSDSYLWNYGDGVTSDTSAVNHTHAFTNFTDSIVSYTIELTAFSDDGCQDTYNASIQVYPETQASFELPLESCTPFDAAIQNTSLNATIFNWDLGNGQSSNEENPFVNFVNDQANDTTFTVCLNTSTNMGCTSSVCHDITIHPSPTADFTMGTIEACSPEPLELTNNSQGADTYQWVYDDGETSTTNDLVHEHLFENNSVNQVEYNISLIATSASGCSDSISQTFTLNPGITVQFSSLDNGCAPLEVDFNNQSLGDFSGFEWDFGNGTSSANNPTNIFFNQSLNDTVYSVTLTGTSIYGCVESVTQPIEVYHAPIAAMEINSTQGCYPLEVFFENQSQGATEYAWVYGTGETGDSDELIHSHLFYNNFSDEPIDYNVALIAYSDQGCSSSTGLPVTVWPQVEAIFISDLEDCSPFPVEFDNQSIGAQSYEWFFGDESPISTEINPIHVYSNFGIDDENYTVQLVAHSFYGCTDTTSVDITVLSTPNANFEAQPLSQIYPDATVTLTNNSVAGTVQYQWDMDDGNELDVEDPGTYTYDTWGEYEIELIATNGSCADTAWQTVEIVPPPPMAFFEMDTAGCGTMTVFFQSQSLYAVSYHWDFGDGGEATVSNPVYTYYQPGVYDVTLTVTGYNNNQSDTFVATQAVTIYPNAQAAFTITPTEVYVPDQPIHALNLTQNATAYSWDFGDGETSEEENPIHYYQQAGVYDIYLVAYNEWNCPDTFYVAAAVQALAIGDLVFPNAFTPNTSGPPGGLYDPESFDNDIFYPLHRGVTEYLLQIYNKWGELLFQTEDVNEGWDGYYKGEICKEDVYAWKVKARFSDNTQLIKAGDVTLLIK